MKDEKNIFEPGSIIIIYNQKVHGMSRAKIQELSGEVIRITREIETFNQDNATYLTFEKK